MTDLVSGSSAAARFDLRGRVAVVTGASKGIGRELVILLAETGAVVVPTARTDTDLAAIAAEARESGYTVHPRLLDVSDVGSINAAVEAITAQHGRIDVLVNNAGLGFARAAFDVSEDDWDEMMGVNLRGMFFMSQAVARTMVAAGKGGRIINISSQGGLVALPDAAVYCTSKGGVNMMTKTLAVEWAKHDITVNALAPTFIYTPGTAPILDEPAMKESVLAKIPLGKFALTNDVAGAIVYLASEAGRMVTGTVLVIDGGWTAQ
ncbi:MAG: 3-oxoacyl-(acyl-carrier-protein) reductase [Devosia sp.]|uniref:SDR family NAD(P)-dependent oxidoreductase n=1 Tax=Devosia sp. TaxID=1871048 RepID=UPI002619264A|nr:SDR family oxidoreductase [Devosia sp.]MDB5528128.1 3-oxoacyl-(acyl-carrier-protein) reductase [Devosia sp.]